MSGIVGSYHNIRGSGVVAKLGTDGQLFTSTGAGKSQGFESAAGGGKFLQIVQYTETSNTISSNSTSWVDITDFKVTITPTAASSKILIIYHIQGGHGGTFSTKIERDIDGGGFTDVFRGDVSSNRYRATAGTGASTHSSAYIGEMSMIYLDSPSYTLTDDIIYQMQWFTEANPTGMLMNRTFAFTDVFYQNVTASSIQAIEIGA